MARKVQNNSSTMFYYYQGLLMDLSIQNNNAIEISNIQINK